MTNSATDIHRGTGVLVIEVRNSNPNGDPDRESDPRHRSHDMRGVISGVSFKRKLRDLLEDKDGPVWTAVRQEMSLDEERYHILESRGRDRAKIAEDIAEGKFIDKYWDGRVFGNTFLEKESKDFLRTGAVQFAVALSVAPIRIDRMTNTSKSGVEGGKDRGMAPLAYRVVEHAVYVMPFFVNPTAAHKTGCTGEDIEVLKRLIPLAYPNTASYLRPAVTVRHGWYVEHLSALGSVSDFALIDALTPKKKGDPHSPSTSWDEYDVPAGLPDALRAKVRSVVDLANL